MYLFCVFVGWIFWAVLIEELWLLLHLMSFTSIILETKKNSNKSKSTTIDKFWYLAFSRQNLVVFTAIFDNLSDIVNWEYKHVVKRYKIQRKSFNICGWQLAYNSERPPAVVEGHCSPYDGCNASPEQVDPVSRASPQVRHLASSGRQRFAFNILRFFRSRFAGIQNWIFLAHFSHQLQANNRRDCRRMSFDDVKCFGDSHAEWLRAMDAKKTEDCAI